VPVLTFILCAAAYSSALADDALLDEIVVVANKDARSIRDVAANVTVISRDDLDANLAVSIGDVFRYAPGIDQEAAGTRFGDEGINIRGIGGNRVAVLLDGVPLGDQFQVGSFSNATRDFLNAGLIQRIEVLHGPASALYGSAAIGGVVAARTMDPADVAGAAGSGGLLQTVWRGADDSLHGTAALALDDHGKGLLLGGSYRDGSEAESAAVATALDVRDFTRRSALAKLVIDDTRGNSWRLSVIHQDAAVTSDLNALLGSGRYVSTTALEGDDDYRMQLVNAAWEFGHPEGLIDRGVVRAYYQATDIRQQTLDERALAARPVAIDRYFRFRQDIRGLELNLHRTLASDAVEHRLGAGLEFRERRTEEYRDGLERGIDDGVNTNVILGEAFPLRDFPRSVSREWGAYAEDALSIGDWSLIAALRADRYLLAPRDDVMFAEDYPFATPVSLRESDVTPKLALMYRPGDAIDIYLQYAQGFRAPPYEDANIGLEIPAFNYRAVPNPELESESSRGYEAGMRWQGSALRLHAALFHTDYDNFIESRVRIGTDAESGRILFQARNLEHAAITGIEAGFQWQPAGRRAPWQLDGSLYGARGENRVSGEPLNSVGPAQAVLGIAWRSADTRRGLRLQVTHTAAWTDRDETAGELFEPGAYTVLDLYATQSLGERTTLRAGMRNLGDTTWWQWSSIRGVAADDVLIPHLAQPGRNVELSITMNW